MALLRENVRAMTAYVPGEQPAAGTRVIKLNTNENPYPPSPRVAEAIARELQNGAERLRLYSDPLSLDLRRAAADLTGFPLDGVLAGNGSDELLSLIVRALVEPAETVAYPYPTYVLYETLAESQGVRVETPAFGRDFSLPRALFGSDAKVVFIASPNSPSGTTHSKAELTELARSLRRGVLVVDEAYVDFAEDSAVELAAHLPNVLVTRTLSKSYSLAGLRVGLMFGPSELVQGIAKIKDSYNLDRLAIAGAAAALRDTAWTQENARRIVATRARLSSALQNLRLEVLPSQANFVFARFESAGKARGAYAFLKDRGILVRYFDRPLLDDGLRITVGTDAEVDALLAALAEFTG